MKLGKIWGKKRGLNFKIEPSLDRVENLDITDKRLKKPTIKEKFQNLFKLYQ